MPIAALPCVPASHGHWCSWRGRPAPQDAADGGGGLAGPGCDLFVGEPFGAEADDLLPFRLRLGPPPRRRSVQVVSGLARVTVCGWAPACTPIRVVLNIISRGARAVVNSLASLRRSRFVGGRTAGDSAGRDSPSPRTPLRRRLRRRPRERVFNFGAFFTWNFVPRCLSCPGLSCPSAVRRDVTR